MDMQAATAPGRMYQQSLTQLGQTIGGALIKYSEKQGKERERETCRKLFHDTARC